MKMAGRKVVVIWREEKWSGMPGKVWASPASLPRQPSRSLPPMTPPAAIYDTLLATILHCPSDLIIMHQS